MCSPDPKDPPSDPKRTENTPQIDHLPLVRFYAVSQVVVAQNFIDNPSTALLGLIYNPVGKAPKP